SGELVERPPAGLGDLGRVSDGDLLVLRLGEEDMRAPMQLATRVREERARVDEIAPKLDMEPGLLERLAHGAGDEVLAAVDAAARRAPHIFGELRLADEREPLCGIEDEERDVVRARRVVRRHRPLDVADLAFPAELVGYAEALAHRREHGLVYMHRSSSRNSAVDETTMSAAARSSGGDSSAATATRTASSRSATAWKASRSVVSSPATSARWRPVSARSRRTAVPLFAASGGNTSSTLRPKDARRPAARARRATSSSSDLASPSWAAVR